MPRMSGFQACSRIKANPQTRDVPVIMPPGTGEVLLTLVRVTPFTPIVVTTPSRAAVSVVRQLMDYLQEQSIIPEVLVINM